MIVDQRSEPEAPPAGGSGADVPEHQLPHVDRQSHPWRRTALITLGQIALLLAVIGLWVIATGSKTQRLTIGTPADVAEWMWDWATGNLANGWGDLLTTLKEAALGYLLGVSLGILVAAVLAWSRWTRLVAAPFMGALNALPKVALAPLFILVFGSALSGKVYFVASVIFFITFYNVQSGIRSVDRRYLDSVKILGAGRFATLRSVYAPAVVVWVMTAMRLSASWAIAAAVIAEYLAASTGMGYIIASGQQVLNPSQVLGAVIILSIVALIVDRVIWLFERRITAWRL